MASATVQHGLIILGNSGVGKSFLANILLDEEVFTHEFSARSVTHRTEFREVTFNNYRYAIFNIPGLIEADQTRVDVNKREIDHAFTKRPNSLVIYVFGQQNGRIRDEDVVAFDAINQAYPLNIDSLLVVVNGLPEIRPDNYEGEAMLMLQDVTKVVIKPERVCFLNQIKPDDRKAKENLRNQLLRFVVELTPTEHHKIQDIHLRVDEVSMLKKHIEDMTKAFEENKSTLRKEIEDHQKRYDQFVAEHKVEQDHFRRIIDRQAEDARGMNERQQEQFQQLQQAHQQQLAMMQTQLQSMQQRHGDLERQLKTKDSESQQAILKALRASQDAQDRLDKKIKDLADRKPEVIVEKKKSSCFIAGTQIRMADGTQKPIDNIQIGDLVLGMNNQHHQVIFLDVEQLNDRLLYSINGSKPFFTSEHVFLSNDGNFVSIDPQASEDEEPSLQRLVQSLNLNVQLESFDQLSVHVKQLDSVRIHPDTIVYNVVLDSGHLYYANDFAVFDMFPNLSRYPRMFKFLHLLWRQCATQIDDHFDDVTTPSSIDRLRLENLAQVVQQTISDFLSKN